MFEEEEDDIFPALFQEQQIPVKKVESIILHPLTIKYPECPKGGYHTGEILNMACTETKCLEKAIICSICSDEEHKGHRIRPLRLIIERARKHLVGMTPIGINITKVKKTIEDSEVALLAKYEMFEKQVGETMDKIKCNIKSTHEKIVQQLDTRTSSKNTTEVIEKLQSKQQPQQFGALVKTLISQTSPNSDDQQQPVLKQKDVTQAVQFLKKKLEKQFDKKTEAIKVQMKKYYQLLEKTSDNPPIFGCKMQFNFSTVFHHNGVEVINPTLVKSIQEYNYHFALMEPSLEYKINKQRTVAFKITEVTNSWVAVGICHKQTVTANDFNFNYSNLGHGAYMISCNGGSWSSLDTSFNNVVTSFSFAKSDVITVNYDPINQQVVFKKKGTEESHTIKFENKPGDELHLCALFYYKNDEVEYIGQDLI